MKTETGYQYKTERPKIFTEDGQRTFLKIRDAAKRLLEKAGAFRLQELMNDSHASGDSWTTLACVDRLVELGEVIELTPHPKVFGWAQNRIFTDGGYRP